MKRLTVFSLTTLLPLWSVSAQVEKLHAIPMEYRGSFENDPRDRIARVCVAADRVSIVERTISDSSGSVTLFSRVCTPIEISLKPDPSSGPKELVLRCEELDLDLVPEEDRNYIKHRFVVLRLSASVVPDVCEQWMDIKYDEVFFLRPCSFERLVEPTTAACP